MLFTMIAEPIQTCPQINKPVRTDQVEALCRAQNMCEQKTCPLHGAFLSADNGYLYTAADALG